MSPEAVILPFGAAELCAAVDGAARVLDAGCGGGRLTIALAQAGAEVTGIDTSSERLEQARRRAASAGVELQLLDADLNERLPFDDGSFEAIASRLSLMIPRDTVAALRELRRLLVPDGRIATALWAALPQNPWFAAPREAIGAVMGGERAQFGRAFGRFGAAGELAEMHRAAGLADVEEQTLREHWESRDAGAHWARLTEENGHFTRLDASLSTDERSAIIADLEQRLAPYRNDGKLRVPRTIVLVTARA